MNYGLPKSLTVNGVEQPIRWEYTAALDAIAALNNRELKDNEKVFAFLYILYENFDTFGKDDYAPAFEAGIEFINNDMDTDKKQRVKMVDFEQDYRIMIAAINRIAGREIRNEDDIHWWTFLGWFMEIGECTYSTVLTIRSKQAKGKKLEKYEQEFLSENKNLVVIKPRMTAEEKRLLEEDEAILLKLLG